MVGGVNKDSKAFIGDLKRVYQAPNRTEGLRNLDQLEEKWGQRYQIVIDSWRKNRDMLSKAITVRYGKLPSQREPSPARNP